MSESEIERCLDVAMQLSDKSKSLSEIVPENTLLHVISPRFKKPTIEIGEYDISSSLASMGLKSQNLLVSRYVLDGEYDGGIWQPPFCTWEIYPPRSYSFIGRFDTSCYQNENRPGIGLTIHCPTEDIVASSPLEQMIADGYVDIDLLFWFADQEKKYDPTKPQSVLFNMIEKHPRVGLEVALWVLEAVQAAKAMHPEEQKFIL